MVLIVHWSVLTGNAAGCLHHVGLQCLLMRKKRLVLSECSRISEGGLLLCLLN